MTETPEPEPSFQLAAMAPRQRRTGLIVGLAVAGSLLVAGGAGAVGYALASGSDTPDPAVAAPASTPSSTPSPATAAAATSTSPTPAVFTVAGSQTLGSSHVGNPQCSGDGGYHDIRGGAAVGIYAPSGGKPLARGTLEAGLIDGTKCVFQFVVQNVPRGKGPYSIIVGSHSGPTLAENAIAGGSVLNLELP